MKYAQLGPMKGILNVTDSDSPMDGMQPLTDEQAAMVEQINAAQKTPFFLEGKVTTLEDFAGPEATAHFDEAIGQWVVVPLAPEILVARARATVPQALANWRVKAVLDMKGLTPTIDGAIDSMPDSPEKIVISRAWHGNGDVQRDSPTVTSFMAILNLSDPEVDDMFRIAATFNP